MQQTDTVIDFCRAVIYARQLWWISIKHLDVVTEQQKMAALSTRATQKKRVTCAGEEVVAIFVEGNGHDPVCEVERLLNAVAMVNIYV